MSKKQRKRIAAYKLTHTRRRIFNRMKRNLGNLMPRQEKAPYLFPIGEYDAVDLTFLSVPRIDLS